MVQGHLYEGQPFQSQPYPGQPFQGFSFQTKPSMTYPGYPKAMQIPTTQAILGYPGYPPPWVGLNTQEYLSSQQDFNRQFTFIAMLDLSDLSHRMNDPIYHYPFWSVIPAKLPSDILKFDGKPREDP